MPSTLDRSFGINKEFNLTSTRDITDVTIYYINQINENYYYVPVTKYLNDTRDKIDIIIDELTINFNPNKRLMSFMNDDVKLVSKGLKEKVMKLEFNTYLVNEEVDQILNKTISLSACDNYDINEVFLNDVQESCKNT